MQKVKLFTSVDSELEAIILESNLIKEFQPRYNVIMKDDKNYVYIKITKEDFPRIQIVRKVEKDNATYIGPKTAAHKVQETFKILKKIFPFRHCNLDITIDKGSRNKVKIGNKVIKYPCLDYYIKRCAAPCIGKCGIEEYKEIIENVKDFLAGKADKIMRELNEKMKLFAKNREFEKAVKIRDKIKKIEDILEKQKVSDPNQEDKDIINYCATNGKAYFNLFQIRDGKLIGQENFILGAEGIEESGDEILESFLNQYYKLATDIPKEILIPHEIEDPETFKKFLLNETGKNPEIIIPKIGTKNQLLEMSLNNAKIFADRNRKSWDENNYISKNATSELQKFLKLKKPIKRIECYDISHLSGTDTVGSMIVFENGIPKNSLYRKFKLKTVQGYPDDYKSLKEVLTRRFSKITEDIKQREYTFRKAQKKDHKLIGKNTKINLNKTDINFYVLEKKERLCGFIGIKEYSKLLTELSNLWISKKEEGKKLEDKLIKNGISKTKAKRVYIAGDKKIKESYLLLGFEEIKKSPKELEKKHKEYLLYDKPKHKPDESFSQIPDLVIIDGGKGQLSSAEEVFKKLNLNIPHISLAKKLEEIFLPDKKDSIILDRTSEILKLLQHARDEAHRFAINYNRNLRSSNISKKIHYRYNKQN
ncbi:excinuclease ABC subunit UvrC [Candidatus Peregrinibacteria bacterium]|nr:excinuclease ABC subunit UvrC [Candidatus Peregrinibacteria bacterium]